MFLAKLAWREWLLIACGVAVLALGFEAVRKSMLISSAREQLAETEAKLLEEHGAFVAVDKTRRELDRELGGLRGEVDSLNTLLGEEPKVKEVVKWKTAPGTVTLPNRCPDGYDLVETEVGPVCRPRQVAGEAPGAGPCPSGVPGDIPPCPEPKIELRGIEARLETVGRNTIAVGQVEVWRTYPPPVEKVQTLPWQVAEVSRLAEPGDRVRWLVGPAFGYGSDSGVQYGAAAVSPAVNLGRLSIRFGATATSDLNGVGAVSASVLFGIRRR